MHPEIAPINENNSHQENEKKYLIDLDNIPFDLSTFENIQIIQGYLNIDPGKSETRLRQQTHQNGTIEYFHTIKEGKGENRLETEKTIYQEEFANLWNQKSISETIEKTRYLIPYGDFLIELDVFHQNLNGLVMAEVEFKSPENKKNYITPIWFGPEVTFDKKYKNQSLVLSRPPLVEADSHIPRYNLD